MQKIYSANQVATLLGIPYSSVRTCMEKGELPYFTLPGGKQKRILEDDFLRFKETVDVPENISRGTVVEIGQTIIIDNDGHLTTYLVSDVSNHKITVSEMEDVEHLHYQGGI